MTQGRTSRRLAIISDAISPYHQGGKEQRIEALAKRLSRSGIEVHIYTMNWWGGARVIQRDGLWLHAISPLRPLYTQSGRRSIWQGITFALDCLRLIREDFDVIEVDHMPFLPLFTTKLVCLFKRQPMYATWHEVWGLKTWLKYLGPLGLVAAAIERVSVLLPNHIIAVSPHTAEGLRQLSHYRGPLTMATNGIDAAAIAAVPAAPRPTDIVFVGRLIKHKNLDVLLRAVALLKIRHPHLRTRLMGTGPEDQSLRELAVELGVQDVVEFTGRIPTDTEKYALLKAARVFVSPSSREGFGITLLEANACGLPVVTVNEPGNAGRHLIASSNGVVCNLTAADLAEAIEAQLARHGAREAAQRTAESYDWQVPAHVLHKVYAA